MICTTFNTDRHPVAKICTSPQYNCRHFTSSLLNFTQLHFTTLSFGLTTFKFPTATLHLTSLHFTSPHFTSQHFYTIFVTPLFHSLHPVYNCLSNFLSKNFRFTVKTPKRFCRQFVPVFNGPVYKGISPGIRCLLHVSTPSPHKCKLLSN